MEIALWYGGLAGSTKATMERLVERFNASQDRVEVVASDQGPSYGEVQRAYESAAAASGEQAPEIVYLVSGQLQAMVDSGRVLPAQRCMEAAGFELDRIDPLARSMYTVDGLLYPGYLNVSTSILYYNRSHWVRAGLDPDEPPETLDEVYEQAKALKRAGVSDRPFVLKLSSVFFENWLNGRGVDMVNNRNGRDGPATEATFDTPEARGLLQFLARMDREGLLNVFASTEGSIDHYLALVTQQSSMIIETSTVSTTIRDTIGGRLTPAEIGVELDASSTDLGDLLPGSAMFPGIDRPGQVIPGGGAFYILNTSDDEQQAASWRFLEFMLDPDNAKDWLFDGGYLPIVRSVADQPEVQAFWENDLAGVLLRSSYDQLAEADPDRPGPLVGPQIDYSREIDRAMEAVLLDEADPQDALATAEDNVTAALERYGTG